MTPRKYLVDILQDIVDNNISPDLTPMLSQVQDVIKGVYYMYGHPREILERLFAKEGTEYVYNKYPLICLFTDIDENKGDINFYSRSRVRIVVVHSTSPDYIAPNRLQAIFKPIIHPIVDKLIEEVALSPYFREFDPDLIERTETDRYYWGRFNGQNTEANWFHDYLDATEISMQLTIDSNCILPAGTKNIK